MDCKTCKEIRQGAEPVPYIVHEAAMARQERTIKKLCALLVLVIILLVGTNCAWLYYENQFEDIETIQERYESETDGGGNAIVNRDGSVTYGKG